MYHDVVGLRSFYAQPLGVVTRRPGRMAPIRALRQCARPVDARHRLCHAVSGHVPRGMRALARLHAGRAGGDALAFRRADASAALVDETELPLRGGAIDRIIAVHLLEMMPDAQEVLREVWRVLAQDGRLLCIVPSRRGIWARTEEQSLRPWPTVLAHPDHRPAARGAVHAGGLGRGAHHTPLARNWFLRSASGVGAGRLEAVAALRRRAHRRGDQASLQARRQQAPLAPQGAQAGAGAGARPAAGRVKGRPSCRDRIRTIFRS